MILHRIAAAFRRQDWSTVFVEVVIVVLGVFLGLQVQEWSEQRSDRRGEIQIVTDMLAELDLDRAQYANGIAAALRRVGAANASLVGAGLSPLEFDWQVQNAELDNYLFDIRDVPDQSADRLDSLWTDIVLAFHPTPGTTTYDAMVGSGDIKLIRDRSLVREIQSYRSRSIVVIVQNEKLISLRQDILRIGASYGLAPYARLPADEYFQLVAGEPELAAAIRIMATFAIFHGGDITSADAHAARLQGLLRAYLEAKS